MPSTRTSDPSALSCIVELRDPGDDERVHEAGQEAEHDDGAQRSEDLSHHGNFTSSRSMSMSLIPMNGTMIPPSP